ncbi:phosphatidylserine decarboxylase-domain-containing protein [Panaeolus papilionaceus]|nr:phosphatidylserine decarboxylase-domain-containing protein [Panaeolus papilionaceus]
MYLIFDLLSNTEAGYDLFRMPIFNSAIKDLLDSWGQYLASPPSASVLNEGENGWFSPLAIQMLAEGGRGEFNATYVVPDPTAANRGYTSWDAFFVRELQPIARPIAAANDPAIIHNACESTVFNIAHNVKLHDKFWLKAQPYSLYDILDRSPDAAQFAGGTVYQGYLSPQDYHRWHAPINGTVKRAVNVPGVYFAALPDEGAEADDPDLKPGDPHGAAVRSQGWLTVASARALVFIESDNVDIGLMCFVGIGMSEVSTCEIIVKEGDRVSAGQQIGMFHFGGSSHAMIFGPQAQLTFAGGVKKDAHLLVNSILAQVQKKAA